MLAQCKASAETSAMRILSYAIVCVCVIVMQLRKSYLLRSMRLSRPDQHTGGKAGRAGQEYAGPR